MEAGRTRRKFASVRRVSTSPRNKRRNGATTETRRAAEVLNQRPPDDGAKKEEAEKAIRLPTLLFRISGVAAGRKWQMDYVRRGQRRVAPMQGNGASSRKIASSREEREKWDRATIWPTPKALTRNLRLPPVPCPALTARAKYKGYFSELS